MQIRLLFECRLTLPDKPVGPGHVALETLRALKEEPERGPHEPHPRSCGSLNLLTLEADGGTHRVACAFCGVPALTVFVAGDAVVVRGIADHCEFKKVEVVDGGEA